ncbi:MAG TPA: hypothetical protein VN685_09725 [Rhizomicrobium sp.]|nr:hypothetical protein [Rhizomicrobium sp.]
MDRYRARIAALLLVSVPVAVQAAPLPIRSARWIAPGADKAKLLSEKPSECLAKLATAELAYQVEVGRAAFNTPLLLGGQASRAGLECESCHRGGRTNREFFFPHVSGKPGTADVTTSVFSSHRGDRLDNPKPIPDLSGPRELLKVSRDPKKSDLRNFIHGLVTEEFDGAEPPPAVMAGLAAYVRSLRPDACPSNPTTSIRMEGVMADASRAMHAAEAAAVRKDGATAVLMVASARTQLGLIYERYQAPSLTAERVALRDADLDLASIQNDLRTGDAGAAMRLALWPGQAAALTAKLQAHENKSLFDPRQLAAAVRRARARKG